MALYLRKSLRAGPFRFNLSKSGLGVSTGVRGFRVGTGPRGLYVNVGAKGLYYRSSRLPSLGRAALDTHSLAQPAPDVTDVLVENTEGSTATDLSPSGQGELVEALNAAAKTFPWALTASLVLVVLAATVPVAGVILLLVCIPGLLWLRLRGKAKRSVVSFYQVDEGPAQWFENVVDEATKFGSAKRLWRVVGQGSIKGTHQHKVNAGATTSVRRRHVKFSLDGSRHLVTNVAVPTITAGRQSLCLLPDRVLVKDGKKYSDVSYSELEVDGHQLHFIEAGTVPSDAEQVGETWQYVNVRGGPDRRYKTNPRRKVMMYGEIGVGSQNGLQWIVQSSRADSAEPLASALLQAPMVQLTNVLSDQATHQ